MTRADFDLHPAADRRTFDCLPVQICGAYEQSRNEDGTGMDLFPTIEAARDAYGDLLEPGAEKSSRTRFFGPFPHVIEGQLVIRYETLAARLRFAGHKFSLIDDYLLILKANGDTELIEDAEMRGL